MSFGGFDTSGVRAVRVTSRTIEGEGASSVVVGCVLEVEHEDGELTEVAQTFEEGQGMTLATLDALVRVLNAHLGS